MKLSSQDKKNKARTVTNEERAIQAHEGFLTCVIGLVQKAGVLQVLTEPQHEKLRWLYLRVVSFAEDVQLKRATLPLVDQSTHHHLTMIIPQERKQDFEARVQAVPV